MPITLQMLPIEMIYRILDHLTDKELFLFASNICRRWNIILNSHQRFQVRKFKSMLRKDFISLLHRQSHCSTLTIAVSQMMILDILVKHYEITE